MKFFGLIVVTFFSISFSYAQNGDAYHAPNDYLFQKRQEKYAQSMIDANSKNTNSTSGNFNTTSNTGGSVEAWLKELQSWNNAPVLKLSAEEQKKKIEEEKIKKLAYQKALNEIKEKNKLNDAIIEDKNRIFRILTEGDRVTLKSAGFENTDADYTVGYFVWDYKTLSKKAEADQIMGLAPKLKNLIATIATIPFDEFEGLIQVMYYYAPLTSFNLVLQVESRFPDKKIQLDNLLINCIENNYISGRFTEEKFTAKYFELIKLYPSIAQPFMLNIYANGKMPYDPYLIRFYSLDRIAAILGMDSYKSNWDSPKNIKAILAKGKLTLVDIVCMINDSKNMRPDIEKAYTSQYKLLNRRVGSSDYVSLNINSNYLKAFEELAKEGNEDAIKLYAISLCNAYTTATRSVGKPKALMFNKMKQWASDGNFTATLMLFKVLMWEQSQTDQHLNTVQNFNDVLAIANKNESLFTKEQLKWMGGILNNIDVKFSPWGFKNGKEADPLLVLIKKYGDQLLSK